MMNIVTLEHEQETEVINKAVTILRSRIIGEVARIETIHQEFLGTAQADEEKKFLLLNLILKRMRIDFNTLCTKIEATSAHL